MCRYPLLADCGLLITRRGSGKEEGLRMPVACPGGRGMAREEAEMHLAYLEENTSAVGRAEIEFSLRID